MTRCFHRAVLLVAWAHLALPQARGETPVTRAGNAAARVHDPTSVRLFAPFFGPAGGALAPSAREPAAAEVPVGVNLLRNGDFESGLDGWSLAARRDDLGKAERIAEGNGNHAVLIEKKEPLPGPPGCRQTSNRLQGGAAYELRLRVRTEGIAWPDSSRMEPVVQIFFRDQATDKAISFKTHRLPTQDTDWTNRVIRFIAPEEADAMQVVVMSHGMTGKLYVDDFDLRRLPKSVGAWPEKRRDGEWMNRIARDIETPHVKWARPLAGGPLKAGVIVQRTGAREMEELSQRFDLDYRAMTAYHPTALGLPDEKAMFIGTSRTEKRTELESLLRHDAELFVVGNLQWRCLPVDARRELFRRVHDEGMGLVLTFQQDEPLAYEWDRLQEKRLDTPPEAITAALPLEILRFGYEYGSDPTEHKERGPGPRGKDLVHAFVLGKGRIVHLRYTYPEPLMWRGIEQAYGPYGGSALTPWVMYDGSNQHHYEYQMMLVARACLWAAQRGAPAGWPGGAIPPIAAGQPASVNLPAAGPLRYTVRDSDHGVVMAEGESTSATINLPALPAGRYAVEFGVTEGGETVAFGAPLLTVTGATQVAQLQVTYADLPHGPVTVTANVTGPAASVGMRLTDTFGRVILDRNITPGELSRGIELSGLQPLTPLHRLDLVARDGPGAPLAAAHREIILPGAPVPDYLLGPYTSSSGYLPAYWRHLRCARDFGQNAQYEIGRWRNLSWPAMSSAHRAGMQHVAGFQTLYKARPWRQPYRDRHLRLVEQDARSLADRGMVPVGIAMGDESNLNWGYAEISLDTEAQTSFRAWLRDRFGPLEAVNARWSTRFTAWSDVTPIALEEAHATGQYTRWYDGWRHLTDRFTELLAASAERVHRHLPGVPIGFEDPIDVGACAGYDLPVMFDHVTFYGAYPRWGHWLTMRSFAKPDAVMLSVSHARSPDPYGRQGRWQLWSSLFHGFRGHLYHRLEGSYDYAAMGYDLSVRNRWTTDDPVSTQAQAETLERHAVEFVPYSEEAKRLNAGAARLVLSAEREAEPVAILHNTATVYANLLVLTATGADPNNDRNYSDNLGPPFVTEHLLNDAHVTYRMIGERDLQGDGPGVRVIILPHVLALGREAADALRGFVREGGTLIAGVRPGVFDDACRPLEQGLLDDVFGVRSGMPKPSSLATGSAVVEGSGQIPLVEYDPRVSLAGATARGRAEASGAPLLIEHAYGKGTAYLWNIRPRYNPDGVSIRDMVDSWGRMLGPAFGNAPMPTMGHPVLLAALRRALDAAGVSGPVRFIGSSADVPAVETWAFARGATRLVGLSRRNYPLCTGVDSVDLSIDAVRHVYDVTNGKYLGRTDRFTVPLAWGDAALVAHLPYRIRPPRMTVKGNTLHLSIDAPADAYHVMHLRVLDPGGTERPEHRHNLVVDGNPATCELPVALNDEPGTWWVEVTDVISGSSARANWAR